MKQVLVVNKSQQFACDCNRKMIVIKKLTQLLAKTGQGMQANSDLTDIEFIVNKIYCSVSDSGAGWDGKVGQI